MLIARIIFSSEHGYLKSHLDKWLQVTLLESAIDKYCVSRKVEFLFNSDNGESARA